MSYRALELKDGRVALFPPDTLVAFAKLEDVQPWAAQPAVVPNSTGTSVRTNQKAVKATKRARRQSKAPPPPGNQPEGAKSRSG